MNSHHTFAVAAETGVGQAWFVRVHTTEAFWLTTPLLRVTAILAGSTLQHLLANFAYRPDVFYVGKHNGEPVAANARNRVIAAHAGTQPARK